MENSILFIDENIRLLSDDYHQKYNFLEELIQHQANKKNEYNSLMKKYNIITHDLNEIEKKIDVLNRRISKNEKKQKLIFLQIDEDFSKQFNDNLVRVSHEFSIFLFDFFGLKLINKALLSKMVKNEFELKLLLRNSEEINKFEFLSETNPDIKKKFNGINENANNYRLEYPFNILFEYISYHFEIYNIHIEKEKLDEHYEEIQQNQQCIFLNLKAIELEVISNESKYSNTVSYMKTIKTLIDERKNIMEIDNEEDKIKRINEFAGILKNFEKRQIHNSKKKFDNLNSLTLKSEYSDYEFLKENSDGSNLNSTLSNKFNQTQAKIANLKLLAINKVDKKSTETGETKGETMENVFYNLTKVKTEANIRGKNCLKKVKNKRLKNLNENSELLVSENETRIINDNILYDNGENKSVKHIRSIAFDKLSFGKKSIDSINPNVSDSITPNNIFLNLNEAMRSFYPSMSEPSSEQKIKSKVMKEHSSVGSNRVWSSLENLEKINRELNEMIVADEMPSSRRKVTRETDLSQSDLIKKNLFIESNNENFFKKSSIRSGFESLKSPTDILLKSVQVDQLENVNEDWIVSPMNKVPSRQAKVLSEKSIRKGIKSMHDYSKLRYDKIDVKNPGCCVSCV